jgi:putative membrane protein
MNGHKHKPQTSNAQDHANARPADSIANDLSKTQAHFAWLRTRMALQTALAGWIRTATSLITFGFAIVQFFEHFAPHGSLLPRYIGLLLIFVGTATTAVVLWEHHNVLRYLCGQDFHDIAQLPGSEKKFPDIARFVALLLCFVGLLAFFAIIARIGFPAPPPR